MKKAVLSQRVMEFKNNEIGDYLDSSWAKFLADLNILPYPCPNYINNSLIHSWVDAIEPDLIILTGGDDPRLIDRRQVTEKHLFNYARKNKIPLLGVCRGMQFIGIEFGSKLKEIKGHVSNTHEIIGELNSPGVNSFHNFALESCPDNFSIMATTHDGSIEAFKNEFLKIYGIMWHPERNVKISIMDKNLFKEILRK